MHARLRESNFCAGDRFFERARFCSCLFFLLVRSRCKKQVSSYLSRTSWNALDIEFNLLNNNIDDSTSESDVKEAKVWLPLLHLSGLFLFLLPPVIIWILKRDEILKMREHGIDVINFQLSMWIIMVPCGIFAFLLITIPVIIFMGFFSTVIIIINTFKVINNQPYKYPMSIKFLKS